MHLSSINLHVSVVYQKSRLVKNWLLIHLDCEIVITHYRIVRQPVAFESKIKVSRARHSDGSRKDEHKLDLLNVRYMP